MRYLIGIASGNDKYLRRVRRIHRFPMHPLHQFSIPQLKSPGYLEILPPFPPAATLLLHRNGNPISWTALEKTGRLLRRNICKRTGSERSHRVGILCQKLAMPFGSQPKNRILPLEAAGPEIRISPVEASARYLLHIRESWNHIMAKGDVESEFEQQEVVLTVPASFDEIARTLTVEAAKMAGYAHITLLEEPQAAFYSWIAQHEKKGMNELYSWSLHFGMRHRRRHYGF